MTQGGLYNVINFTNGRVHIAFLIVTELLEIFGMIIYSIVLLQDKRVLGISRYSFFIISIYAVIFMFFVIATIYISGDYYFIVQHGEHTIFHFFLTLIYGIQAFGMYLFLKGKSSI